MATIVVNSAGGADFTTIQAAIDAATAGDTVEIIGGSYSENLAIDKAISLIASDGHGTVTVNPISGNVVTIGAGIDGDVSLVGLNLEGSASAPNQGIGVHVVPGANVGTLTLDGMDISGAGAYGLFVNGDVTLDAASVVNITDSEFSNNGYNNTNGSAHIKLYGFDGDATFTSLELSGATEGTPQNDRPDYGIEFHGIPNSALGTEPDPVIGTVSISGVVISGVFHKNVIAFSNYGDISGVSMEAVDLSETETIWGPVFNIDAVTGDIDGSSFDILFPSELPPNGILAELQGDVSAQAASDQTITGSDVAERVRGGNGADIIDARGGDDVIVADGGNDSLNGGAGNDTLDISGVGAGGAFVDLDAGTAFSAATGLDALLNIENVRGSSGNDALLGNELSNTFFASAGSDTINGKEGVDRFDASDASDDVSINLDTGSVSGAFTATLTSIEDAVGGAGNDTFVGSSADNTLDGAGGFDTYITTAETGEIGWEAGGFTVAVAGGGIDTLVNIEKASFSDGTVWLVHDAAELTNALASVAEGDTIVLAPGEYSGNFTLSTDNVTIQGATDDAADVIFTGAFKSDNSIPSGTTVGDWLETAPGYSQASGAGFTIAADGINISNITIQEYAHGVKLGSSDNVTLTGVVLDENFIGIYKEDGAASVTGFSLIGGTISNGAQGITINGADGGQFSDVLIDGTSFEHLTWKGAYFEQLSDAQLINITMEDVGQFGRTPSFGGTLGGDGSGIELNLKYDDFSNVLIDSFDFTDVGSSDLNGSGTPHFNGAAIAIKSRDDAPSYSSDPATLDGVTISNGTIDGTSTGIRIGEPGKLNNDPSNVTVSDVEISNAALGDYDNRTTETLTVTLTDGNDIVTTSAAATGDISFDVGGGNNSVTGGAGNDTFVGSSADNTLDGTGGFDTYITTAETGEIGWEAGGFTVAVAGGGIDTLVNIEKASFSDGTVWLVHDAAELTNALASVAEGDTIVLAPGEYSGNFTLSTDNVTIQGATDDAADVIFTGAFKSDNSIPSGTTVGDWLETAPGYSQASGAGFTIAADGINISNITIQEYAHGVKLGSSDNVTLTGVVLDENFIGIYKEDGAASVTGFSLIGGTISNGAQGFTVNAADGGQFSDVLIDGTNFEHLTWKGAYFEQLSDAELVNITMEDVGQFGRTPSFGGTLGGDGSGIELNLKYDDFSNVLIDGFDFTDVGSSNQNGAADPHANGAAIAIKSRDDAPSYSGDPATLDGVTISNGTIDGTSTGIRIGEPGKLNNDPSNVTVSDVEISNAALGDYDNRTTETLTVTLTDGNDIVTTSAAATGDISFDGGAGEDNIRGGAGADNIVGGSGSDALFGGLGADTLTGGSELDTFNGTAAELNGDSITDIEIGESVTILDTFTELTAILSGTQLSIFLDGSVTANATVTLANALPNNTVSVVGNTIVFGESTPAIETVPSDFDGDGDSDVLFQNSLSGDTYMWLLAGAAISDQGPVSSPGLSWVVEGSGDFDGDGKADVLTRNSDHGGVNALLMDGKSIVDQGGIGGASLDWDIKDIGDINADGRDDILWQHTPSGELYVFQVDGLSIEAQGSIGAVTSDWEVQSLSDLNGDGTSDLLFRNTDNGEIFAWLMDGLSIDSMASLGGVGLEWVIEAAGDFDGDGSDDLLFRNTETDVVYAWLMNGTVIEEQGGVGGATQDWQVRAVGDYNADGKTDILWQNENTGELYQWLLDGTTISAQGGIPSPTSDWMVVA